MLTSHPELVYLKFENAKWRIHKDLERGVYPMKVNGKTWIVHEGTKICAKRRGFQFVPDFGQTAHSVQGASLSAVIVDCFEVDHCSKITDMLATYIGLSRVRTKEALLISQPFSPALFCNGQPPGPEILMKVVGREIAADVGQKDRCCLFLSSCVHEVCLCMCVRVCVPVRASVRACVCLSVLVRSLSRVCVRIDSLRLRCLRFIAYLDNRRSMTSSSKNSGTKAWRRTSTK